MNQGSRVLLTGVTGFLGSHTTIQLLEKGYEVIGTLRSMERAGQIREVIARHTSQIDRLSFAEADLNDDASVWQELCQNVTYVQHIASPFPRVLPKREEDLIKPAINGTLAVLRAAADNGVKRVVLTSSSGAIVYGKPKGQRSGTYDENDWTDTSNRSDTTPYFRSKTRAERAAWEFVQQHPNGLELATVCPGAILGPVLEKDFGTSANIVVKPLEGSMPAVPKIGFDTVDVRSVADLLIRAMERPEAANQRFAGTAGFLTFQDVARILKEAYPDRRIPTGTLPNFMVRLISNFETSLKPILIDLEEERKLNNSKAKNVLDWEPRSPREAVLACAESVLELGIVK